MNRFGSAAAAYRADMSGRRLEFDADDGTWLAIATILEHAARLPAESRCVLVNDAIELAQSVVPSSELAQRAPREWPEGDRTPSEIILLVADRAETAGCLHLAAFILDALAAAVLEITPVQRGRIIARRARVAWKSGEIDAAADRYHDLDRLGRRLGNTELRVRANIGYVALAQMRGNYPEMEQFAKRAARLAEQAGLSALARNAYDGLTIAAGARGDVDTALRVGWRVYELSQDDPVDQAAILQNVGQALLDAGHAQAARAAFSAVVSHALPPHVLLPALGGLANAAAQLRDVESVKWAASEVQRLRKSLAPRYALAQALVECAGALASVGSMIVAESLRDAALGMARRHAFHEVVYKAEILDLRSPARVGSKRISLGEAAGRVANDRLPDHASLAVGR
jgi:tetratricopeptide (TPR) repeat protein